MGYLWCTKKDVDAVLASHVPISCLFAGKKPSTKTGARLASSLFTATVLQPSFISIHSIAASESSWVIGDVVRPGAVRQRVICHQWLVMWVNSRQTLPATCEYIGSVVYVSCWCMVSRPPGIHRLGLMHRLSLLALVLLLKGVAEYHSDNQDGCQQLEFAEGRGDCRGE